MSIRSIYNFNHIIFLSLFFLETDTKIRIELFSTVDVRDMIKR